MLIYDRAHRIRGVVSAGSGVGRHARDVPEGRRSGGVWESAGGVLGAARATKALAQGMSLPTRAQ